MAKAGRSTIVDIVRGLTILWVSLFHFYVDTRGVPGSEASAQAAFAAAQQWDVFGVIAVAAQSLVGLPAVRLDVFLFVSGLVLCLGRQVGAHEFLRRRARSILPNYWLGSLAVATLLLGLALLRSWAQSTPLGVEVHGGTMLALAPYRFEWADIPRSLSLVGRFEDRRTMQVVAPSLWYIALLVQLYLVFPWLRAMLQKLGTPLFLAICAFVTVGGRLLVFAYSPSGAFDIDATLAFFLPFRLIAPALGMVAAGVLARGAWEWPRPLLPAVTLPVAMLLILASTWLSTWMTWGDTVIGVLGPTVPLLLAVPGLWGIASVASRTPKLGGLLAWTGRKSLSLLVVQDGLRFVVGTVATLAGSLSGLTWWLMPVYVAAALVLTWLWDPLPAAVLRRCWPGKGASPIDCSTL